jgi:hypothetical protein
MPEVVVSGASQVLAHVPHLASHGSKPRRELPKDPAVAEAFARALRSFEEALGYPPHQAYLNAIHPRDLPARPYPRAQAAAESRFAPAGELMPEHEMLGLMACLDQFGLIALSADTADQAAEALARHPLGKRFDLDALERARADVEAVAAETGNLPVAAGDGLLAAARTAQADDESLAAVVLLDNLATKATATLALLHLLERNGVDPASVDYVIGCFAWGDLTLAQSLRSLQLFAEHVMPSFQGGPHADRR